MRVIFRVLLLTMLAAPASLLAADSIKPLENKDNKPIPLKKTGKNFRLYRADQVKPSATPLNPLPKPGEKKPGKKKEKI